ncbi:MAG: hypothetical protein PVG75_08400 [Thioalkalispiraceae bacterium]
MKKTFPLIVLLLLSACQSGPYPESSPYYRIPIGSELVVKQVLTIPANQARIYIQSGKLVSYTILDQYQAHCWLLSWQLQDKNQIIQPGKFIITQVRELEEFVSKQGDMLIASNNMAALRDMSNGATAVEYKTALTIHSDSQPNIRKLVCNHWEDPADARHLTLAEIRTALGDLMEIKIKTSSE